MENKKNIAIALVMTLVVFIIDILTPLGQAEWLLYFIPLLVAAAALRHSYIPLLPFVGTILIIVRFFLSPIGDDPAMLMIGRAIGIFLLWSISIIIIRRKRAAEALALSHQEMEKRVAERTKVLSEANAALTSEIDVRSSAEEALKASENRMRYIYETISDGILTTTMEGGILECNRAYREMLGYGEDDIKQVRCQDIIPEKWHKLEDNILQTQVLIRGYSDEYDEEYRRKDGTVFPVSLKVWLIKDGQSNPVGQLRVIRDISERKRTEEKIKHMAHHDILTGLPNRRLFKDIIDIEVAQARRKKTKLAILFLDLDRFKEINDTLGHEVGDELLKKVAKRLSVGIRETDTVARIGGDEFNILLVDVLLEDDISKIVRKIMQSFRKPFVVTGHELHITTTIGISIYPDDSKEIDTLFRYADIAMYHAKEKGRNTCQFYNSDINLRSIEKIRYENNLRQAAERGELEVFYQPQARIDTGQIVCVEALVRWRHPEQGLIEPAQFIGMAEETGLITSIDEWVMRNACAQMKEWQNAGLVQFGVTVNFSARCLRRPNIIKRLFHGH